MRLLRQKRSTMKTKSDKILTVLFEDEQGTTYTPVTAVCIEDSGVLCFTDDARQDHFVSPAVRWHVIKETVVKS